MTKLLPLAAALALVGCSLTPDYQRPAAPVPAQWSGNGADGARKVGAGGTAATAAQLQDWRALFTDPRLQSLISAALEHNRDLRIAVGRVEEARALAGLARADRFPGVDLNVQRQAALVPGDVSGTGRPVDSQRYDVNLGVTAFELDFWGRVAALDDAARANFLASDYARRAFRLSLIADVAGAYFSLLESQERSALAIATQQGREETRRLVGKRREVGLASDLDYLAADGAYQSARAEAANLVRQKIAAENALRLLAGTQVELPGGASLAGQKLTADVPVGLPAEVLLERPDVLAAEQKLLAANANIGAARAAFLPRIALTATAGTASAALGGLFEAGSRAWSFVPLLKLPLFDMGRTESNYDLAVARKNIAVADYEKTLQQAFREVADLLAARQYYAEQAEALDAAAIAQNERLKRVEARYAAGVSSQLELLDAQRESFGAQQSALAARRAWLASLASLYKALGGLEKAAAS